MIFLLQEEAAGVVRAPSAVGAESAIVNAALWLKRAAETAGVSGRRVERRDSPKRRARARAARWFAHSLRGQASRL